MSLEAHLRGLQRKILAPYVMCGFPSPESFPDLVRGIVDAGADMLEVGIPFSDPLIDGPVIQRAADIALKAEVRPAVTIRTLESLELGVPFVYMTYVNPILAMGFDEFARASVASGASGVIVPDLPVDEAAEWVAAARKHDLAPVFLAAPTTPRERIEDIAREGAGFVYCVSLLGVTGVRASLSERASGVVERVRAVTDRPALVGLGVSTPEHAAEACGFADGVAIGSAILKAVQEDGIEAAVRLVKEMREAIDG
ncbi:MAG TPA: tryptophan synthase subunit alpha [Actinomycetota bacterium]|jgi:tryptophan synthase alpha chain|nr:tryptophan synthase subunit alpha [Actinomycetota bacterium]